MCTIHLSGKREGIGRLPEKEKPMSNKAKRMLIAIALILVAVLSFTVLYNAFSADEFVRAYCTWMRRRTQSWRCRLWP